MKTIYEYRAIILFYAMIVGLGIYMSYENQEEMQLRSAEEMLKSAYVTYQGEIK